MFPIEKKIFVVGTGRCGSTWIGTWLRQHPEIFGGPETHIFRIIHQLNNPLWTQGLRTWISSDRINQLTREYILQCLGECKFRKEGQNHLVEYSACHYYEIDFIQELFPDAFFIHPYRDVRNVVESKIRNGIKPEDAMKEWIDVISDMQNRKSDKIMNIKYESLVESPELSRTITDFIGLKHHKDIDSWEFPVNTSNFSYDPQRWKQLPTSIISMIEDSEIVEQLMLELKYV